MTLTFAPNRLVSLEGAKDAIVAMLKSDLADALDVVAERFPEPAITLRPPDERDYYVAVVIQQERVQNPPAIVVTGWNIRKLDAEHARNQVLGSGEWLGTIVIDAWLQDPDTEMLTRSLDRYAAAMWLVAINNDPIPGGFYIQYGTEQIHNRPVPGAGGNARVSELTFDVKFRT